MGTLKGDLAVMSLPDVVIWLANRQKTGMLVITRGGVSKQVGLQGGNVTQSSSDDPRERLGQHLMNFGYISEQQLTVAFQTQQETGVPLGRVLIASGVMDEDRLTKALNYKTRECLLDAFEWEQGTFEFRDDAPRETELDAPTPTPLGDIHSEGMSRRAMWDEIKKVVPGPQYSLDVLAALPSNLNPFDRRLLEFATMGRTIGEIALEMRALDFHVFARVYDLVHRSLVRARADRHPRPGAVPPPLPAEVLAPVPPASREELLTDMRVKLVGRRLEEAYMAAHRLLEIDPNNAEALALVQQGGGPPAPTFTLTPAVVPLLKVPREQLDEYLLTSKERYVLSRIDGRRTLKQIIQVSPIQEVELMRIVEAFVQRGFVAV
jgi:hypothetical protein